MLTLLVPGRPTPEPLSLTEIRNFLPASGIHRVSLPALGGISSRSKGPAGHKPFLPRPLPGTFTLVISMVAKKITALARSLSISPM